MPAPGEGGELLTERRYSVGLAKAVGEERDAQWRSQVQKANFAVKAYSTAGARFTFRQ